MKELKPQDRVRVWGWNNVAEHSAGAIAKVVCRIEGLGDVYELRWIGEASSFQAHRKQLRKLVKKERRRVWVRFVDHSARPEVFVGPAVPGDAIEFVEVRKAKP